MAATPQLAHRTQEELLDRCCFLQKERTDKPIRYGVSPPLITQWEMTLPSSQSSMSDFTSAAVGQLEDGRTIWLHYHVIGRLPGDPFSDLSSSVVRLIPGGYLEAEGGRIYELGQPRQGSDSSCNSEKRTWSSQGVEKFEHTSTQDLTWWMPATIGTVTALLTSTVLSACIGYGAGLGIVSEDPGPHQRQVHSLSEPASYGASTASAIDLSTRAVGEPSMLEQEARARYRLLCDERIFQETYARLQLDKMELQHLQEQLHGQKP